MHYSTLLIPLLPLITALPTASLLPRQNGRQTGRHNGGVTYGPEIDSILQHPDYHRHSILDKVADALRIERRQGPPGWTPFQTTYNPSLGLNPPADDPALGNAAPGGSSTSGGWYTPGASNPWNYANPPTVDVSRLARRQQGPPGWTAFPTTYDPSLGRQWLPEDPRLPQAPPGGSVSSGGWYHPGAANPWSYNNAPQRQQTWAPHMGGSSYQKE